MYDVVLARLVICKKNGIERGRDGNEKDGDTDTDIKQMS